MGRLKQKGKAGAAKAYMTRSSAVKKLQCSLADFRRLCILKGIFPREPRNKKKANKGSSAPTTFYYTKDIAYLTHEPVLKKLREHKAFAKKLSRALGRGEWSSAKSLEDNKPVYKLDHIIKERYPTFVDAVRDIDDALCLVSIFASLPSNARVPKSLIENCARLSAEWQIYVMHTHALRKVFLSIKGVYFQAEVKDQTVNWLVPYQFTQNIPTDVDIRVMLTFLELYQTLLGFVFFKLYTDENLAYPLPLDSDKDAAGAGVGAYVLQEAVSQSTRDNASLSATGADGKKVSGKNVRQTIKTISLEDPGEEETNLPTIEEVDPETETGDDFVVQPSKSNPAEATPLVTLRTLSSLPQSTAGKLFSPFVFFLSRETSRPLFEFIIRSFGGRVGWPATSGSGSPVAEADESITHVIIDRPLMEASTESVEEKERRRKRKYVQPQWVADCVNAGKILSEEPYLQGKILPPHLSPFGEDIGAYNPSADKDDDMDVYASDENENAIDESAEEAPEQAGQLDTALDSVVARAAADPEYLRTAELEAEARGLDFGAFEEKVAKAAKKAASASKTGDKVVENDVEMNKMMMSKRQRKLYDRMKYTENKRATERAQLEEKRRKLTSKRRTNEP